MKKLVLLKRITDGALGRSRGYGPCGQSRGYGVLRAKLPATKRNFVIVLNNEIDEDSNVYFLQKVI